MLSLLRDEDSLKTAIVPDYSRPVSQLFFDICTKVCKDISEVERFRTLLELAPDRRVVKFVCSNWPLRLQEGTYGNNQLDMCVALLLPRNMSYGVISATMAAPGVLIPRHLAARQNLYASMPLQRGLSTNIRILQILPADTRGDELPIKCSLRTIPFIGSTPYVALSHAWGSETPTKLICVNGHNVNVRENLWAFLKQARNTIPNIEIWIDAVCINQEDLIEKTHHAKMTKQIYSGASKVITWLGQDKSKTTCLSVETITKTHAKLRDPYRSLFGRENWPMNLDAAVEESLNAADTVIDSLQGILSNQYWRRTWIVQEYVLAKQVDLWIDDFSLDGQVLSIMCEAATKWPRRLPLNVATAGPGITVRSLKFKSRTLRSSWAMNIIMQRDLRQDHQRVDRRWSSVRKPGPEKWRSLRSLLSLLAESDCTDPRDRVYALLPLLTSEELQYFDIIPDYSTPGSRLFIDLTCAFCVRSGLTEGWDAVQHLAEPLCSEGYVDFDKLYRLLGEMLKDDYGAQWQRLASQVVYEMSGKQACFEPPVRDGG